MKSKAAVIGLGNIGLMYDLESQRPHPSTHAYAYEQSAAFDLVCGIDSDNNKRALFSEKTSNASFYSDLDSAIESGIMDGVDVISICTPPNTHLEILLKLIKLNIGKILFCEKPLVSNMAEVNMLNKALEKNTEVLIIPNISRRWNNQLREIPKIIKSTQLGKLEKINIRYTRGIENTGTHLFDLLKMLCDSSIIKIIALGETKTSILPEPTYSFYFEMDSGVTGYAEAIDDTNYYLFDFDLYLSNGKIEIRNSGDDIIYYETTKHHLFDGFKEFIVKRKETNVLQDACIKNAVENIAKVLNNEEKSNCTLTDAIYPLIISEKLKKSFSNRHMEEIKYV